MAATLEPFACTECGAPALRWAGRCPSCGSWNSVVERSAPGPAVVPVIDLAGLDATGAPRLATGIAEVDRVLGGGVPQGSVTLVVGAPGIGKSTLCLQAAGAVASAGGQALVVAAEESAHQVAERARRLGGGADRIAVLPSASLPDAVAALAATEATLVVVDSVSTLSDPSLKSPSGGVAQVRAAAEQLSGIARARGIALLLVGHVTKDGELAGPRALEHLVDTVVIVDGDRHHRRRVVTTTKHRFGAAGEVGLLELDEHGISSVDDPSATLVAERGESLPGSAASVLAEGTRPLVIEIQALVTPAFATPARVAQGVSATRLRQLAAVLDAHGDLGLGRVDLFVACAGAVRAAEPAVDLAVAAAAISALRQEPIDSSAVFIGEIGLTGAIRAPLNAARRLAEAMRVGLDRAVVAPGTEVPDGIEVVEVATVAALAAAVLVRRASPPVSTIG